MIQVDVIPSSQDNYIYVINSEDSFIIVDPGTYKYLKTYLASKEVKDLAVLITHTHRDHTDGLGDLLLDYPQTKVYAQDVEFAVLERNKYNLKPANEVRITPNKPFFLQGLEFFPLDTPGHCANHLTFILENSVFCGDLLFSIGCGRVQVDGNMENLYNSIVRLKTYLENLSDKYGDFFIFGGHEYTLSNIEFAKSIGDKKLTQELEAYEKEVESLFAQGLANTPVSFNRELEINPFLRAGSLADFAYYRTSKDNFSSLMRASKFK